MKRLLCLAFGHKHYSGKFGSMDCHFRFFCVRCGAKWKESNRG